MTKIDNNKLRQELIEAYTSFIINSKDSSVISKMIELDRRYSGAVGHFLDKDIEEAISLLGFIIQKKLPYQRDRIEEAKKMLSCLEANLH